MRLRHPLTGSSAGDIYNRVRDAWGAECIRENIRKGPIGIGVTHSKCDFGEDKREARSARSWNGRAVQNVGLTWHVS